MMHNCSIIIIMSIEAIGQIVSMGRRRAGMPRTRIGNRNTSDLIFNVSSTKLHSPNGYTCLATGRRNLIFFDLAVFSAVVIGLVYMMCALYISIGLLYMMYLKIIAKLYDSNCGNRPLLSQ